MNIIEFGSYLKKFKNNKRKFEKHFFVMGFRYLKGNFECCKKIKFGNIIP